MALRLAQTRGKRTLVGALQGEELVAEDPLAGLGDLQVKVGVLAERDTCSWVMLSDRPKASRAVGGGGPRNQPTSTAREIVAAVMVS
jgi:hypothetical protein